MSKTKLKSDVAVVGPSTVTREKPIVVSITRCTFGKKKGWGTKSDPFPGAVKLAILERDTWTGGDDVVAKKNEQHVAEDDLVIVFEGKLEPNGTKLGATFVLDESAAAKALVANRDTSTDRVWLNFEGRTGEPFELCLPRDASEGDETFFLEVSAVITEAPVALPKKPKFSSVAVSRPRTPHTVLAVEPLSQASMSKNGKSMGVIMKAFHPKAGAKSKLRDRAWARYMLKRTSDKFFQSTVVGAGCSLIALTMVLRYLRVPDGAGGLISLYDKVVQPMVDGKTLKAKYAPRRYVITPKTVMEKLHGVYGGKKKKKDREALIAALGRKPEGTFFGIEFEGSNHDEKSEEGKRFIRAATLNDGHYWPVMLLWYMRQNEKIEESYDIKLNAAHKLVVVEGPDGTKKVERERFKEGDLVVAQGGKATSNGPRYLNDEKGYALDATSSTLKDFGLQHEAINVADVGAEWETRVTEAIDDGLPVVVLLSKGIYSRAIGLAETPGHWCIIVGYRDATEVDGTTKRHYILNDPARGSAPQYDMLREDMLAPMLAERGLGPSDQTGKAKARELQGWNLPIERRKLLSARVLHIFKPKGWVGAAHKKTLRYDGRSEWTEKDGA